ncbi:LuxR C-terminal-related transcriptional regulator [Amycolatopsis sp.]|uniref:LuxR C-terminal-related transcriptional regulator n=1 Tax=Amycolatopsis sp. TaxID=37632 RepID=UPI002B916770|nr:LuxR C-terminal-related transcriptional regulator [Amycolatopsis sp.]HVV07941.1 LuxR C-terminal-related transcriptional regulator [Amycolatopsis sp.]
MDTCAEPGELIRRSRDTLREVAALTGGDFPQAAVRDLRSAEIFLRSGESGLLRELSGFDGQGPAGARIAAALARVSALRTAIRDSRLAAHTAAMSDLQRCLGRLRSASSLQDLAQRVPAEINRLGYRRALFSSLTGPNWSARSAYAYADPQLSADLVRVGTAIPGQLGRELPETEVVRNRTPVLVEDAQHNPHVHHRLINLARTKDYVVAPLVGRGQVIGLLHADQHVDHDHVDEFDQRLLGLFAEGLGCVFERVVFHEQLAAMRERLREQADAVDDVLDGLPEAAEPPRRADPLEQLEGPFAELTRRELDVLRHLVRGESNSQIAAELFVSPGTVKTHVKNVLRKLGVANRAEATARYHALVRRR